MSIKSIRKELNELRKITSYEKPIEILLKSDPKTLTDYELFRVINHYNPEIKTEEQLTTELLEKMVKGEIE
jgi:hypothetical protein